MNRKPKAYSGRNNTSAESDYLQDQARVEALRNKREQISEHRRVTHHGSTEEKAELKSKISQDANLQLYIKQQRMNEEREKSQRENEAMENHRRQVVEMERQREMEKRERLRQAQESNRLAALSKKSTNLERKVYDDVRDRDEIHQGIQRYQPNVL